MKYLAIFALLLSLNVHAESAVHVFVPAPPGGGTDALLRIVAKEAEQYLGEPVRVVNGCATGRCLSGGAPIGWFARARADGRIVAGTWTAAWHLQGKGLDGELKPFDDIAVLQVTAAPYVACTRHSYPAESGAELLERLRNEPDVYTYGTDGFGNGAHLAMTRIFNKLGISQRDVPFKGSGETLVAMLGGHIDIYVGSLPPVIAHVRAGRAKCQMLTSAKKVEQLPQASSLDELGLGQEETLLWRGIVAPKGTPEERIRQLETAFEAAANAPATRAYVEAAGEQIVIYKGDAFRRRIDAEYEQFGKLAAALRSQ